MAFSDIDMSKLLVKRAGLRFRQPAKLFSRCLALRAGTDVCSFTAIANPGAGTGDSGTRGEGGRGADSPVAGAFLQQG